MINLDIHSTIEESLSKLASGLTQKLEEHMVEGLKRKGFEFDNKADLERFVKLYCRCEDKPYLKQKTYFVYDIPFFLYIYGIEMEMTRLKENGGIKLSATCGSFAYL